MSKYKIKQTSRYTEIFIIEAKDAETAEAELENENPEPYEIEFHSIIDSIPIEIEEIEDE